MDMYATRHEWFNHEMEKHRKTWCCIRCPQKPYDSQARLKEHITAKHPGDFTPAQLPFVLEMCGDRPDRLSEHSCPLCDSWDGGSNEDYSAESLRRHLGFHLQELALSSLPPYIEGLEICGNEYAGGEVLSNPLLNLTENHTIVTLPELTPRYPLRRQGSPE
jgi:hypothetical protein